MRLKLGSAFAVGVGIAASSIGLQAGSAQAASCLLTNLAGCDVTIGDYKFSNFSFSGFTASATDFFDLTSASPASAQVALSFLPPRTLTPVSGTFGYTITLLEGRTFDKGQSQLGVQFMDATGTNTTTLTSPSGFTATYSGTSNGSSSLLAFNPNLTSQTFTQTFSLTPGQAGVATNVVGGFLSTPPGTADVPGPLPILGAAAAFRLSRRIRSRIKASV